jgi:hypothetical protein
MENDAVGVGVLLIPAVIGIGLYVFACYCLQQICVKAGKDPGGLIWVPILQMIPLFDAAGLNPLLILLFLVPVANVVIAIILWVKLCEARGKPGWLGILSIIPGLNLALILYLAFAE